MVRSQIGNLTPSLYFGHNLCFKYPNGSCEPILDFYVSRIFQWYKKTFNPMNFDPYNCPLKIQKSIETPIPKVEVHLGMWGFIVSHSSTLPRTWNVTLELHSWPTPSQALTLVVNPKLGLWQWLKLKHGHPWKIVQNGNIFAAPPPRTSNLLSLISKYSIHSGVFFFFFFFIQN